MIYSPQEDSVLLQKQVIRLAKGRVLDLGTGSGIQARAAAKIKRVKEVVAADVDSEVVKHCKKSVEGGKIRCVKSDLFKNIKGVFDTIIFNPPYLPHEPLGGRETALEGGKHGYEIIERFLAQANKHLKTEGNVLLAFSSLTNKPKVEELIEKNLFDWKELDRAHIFFEDIIVYLLQKSRLLKKLERKSVRNVAYFAKGKRSLVFTGDYKGRKVTVKIKNPKSKAKGRIKNEARTLKKMNKLGIGPKLLLSNDFVVYEFVKGDYLKDWLPKASPKTAKQVVRQLFDQCFKMDKAGIAKEEMLRPLRNAIVSKGKVVLIDFERAHKSKKARNVTQLCQFARNWKDTLSKKQIKVNVKALQQAAKNYKHKPTKKNYEKILEAAGLW